MSQPKQILISIEVKTDKELKEITAAITKGLYYGLDVKRIAPPNAVKIIEIKELWKKNGEKTDTKLNQGMLNLLSFWVVKKKEEINVRKLGSMI